MMLVGMFALFSTVTFAEPMTARARGGHSATKRIGHSSNTQTIPLLTAAGSGYTLVYSFSSDPQDLTYTASFTPDVQAIYAWGTVEAEGGAAEKQFTIDTQFIAPDGTPVDSQLY